jgi:hypothetical protein
MEKGRGRSVSVILTTIITSLLILMILSGSALANSVQITICSPDTAKAGETVCFDILLDTGGATIVQVILNITGSGYTVACEPYLTEGGQVCCYACSGTSYVKVTTECTQNGATFHVEWKTPMIITAYAITFSALDYGCTNECKTLNLLPPTTACCIGTCDSTGTQKDTFKINDDVFIMGNGYPCSTTYCLYIVNDVPWTDGMNIPAAVQTLSVTSDTSGNICATLAWHQPLTQGKYDVLVDVNGNTVYDAGIDALYNMNIQGTAGFFVIPEYIWGAIMAVAGFFAALGAYRMIKHKKTNWSPPKI